MDSDDITDLMAYWRHAPPAGLVSMAGPRRGGADEPPPEPPSPEQLQRALDSFNARFAGKSARV